MSRLHCVRATLYQWSSDGAALWTQVPVGAQQSWRVTNPRRKLLACPLVLSVVWTTVAHCAHEANSVRSHCVSPLKRLQRRRRVRPQLGRDGDRSRADIENNKVYKTLWFCSRQALVALEAASECFSCAGESLFFTSQSCHGNSWIRGSGFHPEA